MRKAREDKDIKAVVLRVNSPAGVAPASDMIWREAQLLAEEKNKLAERNSELAKQKGNWESRVKEVKAINITFESTSAKGKIYEGTEFKARQLHTIQIKFHFEENEWAEKGTKNITVAIIEPDGSVLYDNYSGTDAKGHTFQIKAEGVCPPLFYEGVIDVDAAT